MPLRDCALTTGIVTAATLLFFCGTAGYAAEKFDALRVGTQTTYRIKYHSRGYTDFRAAIGTAQGEDGRSRHDLGGTLEADELLTVLERGSTGSVLASIKLVGQVVGIQVDGNPQPDRERQVAQELTETVYFYVGDNGRLDRIEFPKRYSSIARNLVRAILSTQQFVVPANSRMLPGWATIETGANGKYSARYQLIVNSRTGTRVSKTISNAPNDVVKPKRSSTGPEITARTVPTGRIEYKIEGRGAIQGVQATFHEDMFVQDRLIAAQDTTYQAEFVSQTSLPRGETAAANRAFMTQGRVLSAATSVQVGVTPDREKAVQQQILGRESSESLQLGLSLVDRQGASRERKTDIYLKLKALLYLEPSEADAFGKKVATADFEKPSAEIITTALASVGSAEAQNALCSAIRTRSGEPGVLVALVPALGSVSQPSEQVVALLKELAGSPYPEVRSVAVLALGAAAKNLSSHSADRSNRIVRDLAKQLTSSTQDEKGTILLALGNTGSDTARIAILNQKTDRSSAIRRSVSSALAGFESSDSDQALCHMLKADEDSHVRAAAAQALVSRNRVTLVKIALLAAAQQDKADNVRVASLFALTNLLSKDDGVRTVMERAAKSDGSEVVRQQASSLLEQMSPEAHGAKASNR
jgi:HEAT repeat protein